MDRIITYTKSERLNDDEILYSDCKIKPGLPIKVESEERMKLMFLYHIGNDDLEYYYEHYEPEEVHGMFDENSSFVVKAFIEAGGSEEEWLSITYEDQVYYMSMCYDYYTDSFDMKEFRFLRLGDQDTE